MQSILIKDTTREERIRIVNQSLQVCGQTCEFCNGCDNLGGGLVDSYFQPYRRRKRNFRIKRRVSPRFGEVST